MELTVLFTHLKIILLQYFQFSVSATINSIQTEPRRALNIEAVACTFRPLWRTKGSFHITNARSNLLLFDFDLEVDAEKVLLGKPWSYDRHLVIFQRFDGSMALKEIEFKFCVYR